MNFNVYVEIRKLTKKELKSLTKNQLIELIFSLSDDFKNSDKGEDIVPIKTSKNSSKPSSKDLTKSKSKKEENN